MTICTIYDIVLSLSERVNYTRLFSGPVGGAESGTHVCVYFHRYVT